MNAFYSKKIRNKNKNKERIRGCGWDLQKGTPPNKKQNAWIIFRAAHVTLLLSYKWTKKLNTNKHKTLLFLLSYIQFFFFSSFSIFFPFFVSKIPVL